MNKETIKKYQLEEAVRRFQQINEYTFITAPTLSEDGEEDMNNNQQQPADNNGNGQQIPQQNDGNMNNGMADANGMNGGMDMNQQPMQQPPMDNGDNSMPQDVSDDMPMDNNMNMGDNGDGMEDDEFNVETEEMGPDDEVVDVDELTTSQEATEYKVDDVNNKLSTLLRVVKKFTSAIEQNDQKIEDLKAEFEKRNPTQQEKLNIRSQSSYPYSNTPKEYWDKKVSENPNYNVIYDNDVPASEEQKKFEIRQKDVDNVNVRDIMKSFDEPLNLGQFLKF